MTGRTSSPVLALLVVGLGPRGREWAREVRRHPAWSLAGIVEVDSSVLAEAGEELTVPDHQRFDDLQHALETVPSCDAVIVATPADLHVESCQTALSAGRAVLVEKPFALDLAAATALVRQAEVAGTPVLVAQNHRYLRSHRSVRRLVQEGALGPVGLVVSHYYRVPHVMSPSLQRLPHRVLWGMAIHHLDALRYVLARPAVGVFARSFTMPGGEPPLGGSMEMLLEFEGGTRATYGATYESRGHQYFEGGQEFYQRVVGDRGTLHVWHRWLILCQDGKLPRPVWRGPRRCTEEATLLDQLAGAIAGRTPVECSGRDNLQTVAIAEACVRSAQENRWINPQDLLRDHA